MRGKVSNFETRQDFFKVDIGRFRHDKMYDVMLRNGRLLIVNPDIANNGDYANENDVDDKKKGAVTGSKNAEGSFQMFVAKYCLAETTKRKATIVVVTNTGMLCN